MVSPVKSSELLIEPTTKTECQQKAAPTRKFPTDESFEQSGKHDSLKHIKKTS